MAMDASEIERLIKDALPDAEVRIDDLAGDGDHYAATVIAGPITGTRPLAGDRGACEFTTAGYASVIVSLRPNGKATLAVWKSGRMPVSGTPLAGVGDDAVWVGSLDEVVAERNDLLCDIQVNGFAAVLHDRSAAAEQKAVGALCNRIFEEVR